MQECLTNICKEFESVSDFLTDKSEVKVNILDTLFFDFLKCFSSLKEEKLEYPNEFISDVRLYNEKNKAVVNKFKDIEMKYLMLSDFYDFCRITKKYTIH